MPSLFMMKKYINQLRMQDGFYPTVAWNIRPPLTRRVEETTHHNPTKLSITTSQQHFA